MSQMLTKGYNNLHFCINTISNKVTQVQHRQTEFARVTHGKIPDFVCI